MATMTFEEYIKGRSCKGFESIPHYFENGDYLSHYLSEERCYSQRIDELLTVYRSMVSNDLVGFKIKGVKRVMQNLSAFGIRIEDDKVDISYLFISAAALVNNTHREAYEECAQKTQGQVIDKAELPMAA